MKASYVDPRKVAEENGYKNLTDFLDAELLNDSIRTCCSLGCLISINEIQCEHGFLSCLDDAGYV